MSDPTLEEYRFAAHTLAVALGMRSSVVDRGSWLTPAELLTLALPLAELAQKANHEVHEYRNATMAVHLALTKDLRLLERRLKDIEAKFGPRRKEASDGDGDQKQSRPSND